MNVMKDILNIAFFQQYLMILSDFRCTGQMNRYLFRNDSFMEKVLMHFKNVISEMNQENAQ